MDVYEVGGAVRDELLGQPVTERDWVVVGATPQDLLDLGYRPVGKDFPVFLHPDTAEEYALARTERKTAPGYRGFAVDSDPGVTLEQDLMRRDLTINAIARSPDGRIVDPFDGRGDLERRVLRHVSPAFSEDPVRILRAARFAARFAALGFSVAPETLALMRSMVDAGEADALVPERVWKETLRALQTTSPAVFLQVLRDCGALAVIFPEIDRLFGVPQPPRWHPEIDTGVHTLMVVDAAAALSDDARVRFAAMTHDLGKGETPVEQLPSHRGHEAGSVRLVEALCKRLRIPNDYRDLAVAVARYHGHSHRLEELRPKTILGTLEALDAFRRPERFDGFLLACEADARGRGGLERNPYPQSALFRRCRDAAAAVALDAADREGLAGAEIGKRLRARRLGAVKMVLRGPALT